MNFLQKSCKICDNSSFLHTPANSCCVLQAVSTVLEVDTDIIQSNQGRIQDLIGGGAPDRDRPKTAILGPQFCRIFGAGASFLVVRGGPGPPGPPLDPPLQIERK